PPWRPRLTSRLLLPLLATIRSGMPSPSRSARTTALGASSPEDASPSTLWAPSRVITTRFFPGSARIEVAALDGPADCTARPTRRGARLGDRVGGQERAVAPAVEDQHVAESVRDHQVGRAVAVDVGDGQPGGLEPGDDRLRPPESSLSVVQEDLDAGGVGDGQ